MTNEIMPVAYQQTQLDYSRKIVKDWADRNGMKPTFIQWKWRGNGKNDPLPPFNMEEIEIALLDALCNMGGIVAWRGDGLGCAAQIVEYVYKKQEQRIKQLEDEIARLERFNRYDGWRDPFKPTDPPSVTITTTTGVPVFVPAPHMPLCPVCGKMMYSHPRLGISHACLPDIKNI